MTRLRVQFGCWKDSPEGWTNFDCSPYLVLDRVPVIGPGLIRLVRTQWQSFPGGVRYGNIIKGLPVEDRSCEAVYCSHVLEHLSRSDLRVALENTFRMTAPGGVFRFVLPDLARLIDNYVRDGTADAAGRFMIESGLGVESRGGRLYEIASCALGSSRHLWLWDFESIRLELSRTGFTGVRRATYGDSDYPCFANVERQDRWTDCLGVECVRPT